MLAALETCEESALADEKRYNEKKQAEEFLQKSLKSQNSFKERYKLHEVRYSIFSVCLQFRKLTPLRKDVNPLLFFCLLMVILIILVCHDWSAYLASYALLAK